MALWLSRNSRFRIFPMQPGTGRRSDWGDPGACHRLPVDTRSQFIATATVTELAVLRIF